MSDGLISKDDLNDNLNQELDNLTSHLADYVAQPANAGTTEGTSTAYTIITEPEPTALIDKIGAVFTVHVDSGNNPTLQWGDLEAKPILKPNGNPAILKANGLYTVRYNAVNDSFILQGEGGEYGTALPEDVLNTKTLGTEQGIKQGAMDLSNLIPDNIAEGVTINHVEGVLKSLKLNSGNDTILFNDSNVYHGSSLTPISVGKKITTNIKGSITISFTLQSNQTINSAYGQIYKNGSPTGILGNSAGSYLTFVQNFTCEINDVFELKLYNTNYNQGGHYALSNSLIISIGSNNELTTI